MTTDRNTSADDLRVALTTLTAAQQVAVDHLAVGATHAAAAEAAGVARETVTRWVGAHPGVRAALSAYRDALAVEQADRARMIRSACFDIVAAGLASADLPTALAVLRAIPAPPEQTTAPLAPLTADVLIDIERDRTRRLAPPTRPKVGDDQYEDLLDQINGNAAAAEFDRIECMTLSRLAEAAGVAE